MPFLSLNQDSVFMCLRPLDYRTAMPSGRDSNPRPILLKGKLIAVGVFVYVLMPVENTV
jgi:hypothetical protein